MRRLPHLAGRGRLGRRRPGAGRVEARRCARGEGAAQRAGPDALVQGQAHRSRDCGAGALRVEGQRGCQVKLQVGGICGASPPIKARPRGPQDADWHRNAGHLHRSPPSAATASQLLDRLDWVDSSRPSRRSACRRPVVDHGPVSNRSKRRRQFEPNSPPRIATMSWRSPSSRTTSRWFPRSK